MKYRSYLIKHLAGSLIVFQVAPSPHPLHDIAKMQWYTLMAWAVELLDDRVRGELEALPPDMQARFRRIVELIQGYGLERVH